MTTNIKTPRITTLDKLGKSQEAIIVDIAGCTRSAKRLADLGLTPKTKIQIVRKTALGGPIEIKAKGTNLVLGRGIATKIRVECNE